MKLKEKVYKPIFFLIIAVFVIMNFSITIFANDDYYISIILLTIKAEDNIIEQDDFFKIIDHDQYILIPLSALSSYLEIKIDYKRENEELLVYNPQKDEIVVVDFKENKYPDFPEWNDEPPLMLEGDFFVSIKLIEYLIDADLEWSSLKQELILDFADYIDKAEQDQETKIKNRPKKKIIKPEITGPNFSLGSLHYNTELNYSIEDLKKIETGDLKSNNNFYLHGRAGDWALSSGINLIYNFQEENYRLNYPLIRAINKENNRFIILGDSGIDFENTVDDLNTEFGANTVVDQNIEGPTATALDDSGVINVDQSQTQEISTSLLLENDSGTDISVTDVSTGNISEDGTATLDGDTITFEAASDYTGPADFQYTVTNANDKTDTAMVTGDVASSSPVEGPTLELGDAQVEPGGTANLTLELNTPDNTDVASLSTDITYDSSILSNFSASIGTAGEEAGKSIESSSPAQDTFRVGVLSFSTDPIPDGAVAELSFDIASDAEIGSETELTQDAGGSTPEADSVDLSDTSGIVEIVDQATSQNLEIMGVQESNASEMSLDIA